MKQTEWFTLMVTLAGRAPSSLFVQEQKDGMYVGPHTRLAGFNGVAHLSSRELAVEFSHALTPIFERRYGPGFAIEVEDWSGGQSPSLLARIEKDTEIVRLRLQTGNFAPNKPVF
ncbi:MAG: hypothetical protein K0M46_00170 [Thiobacillus sp.]|nr:hypothetical protein [Thiobacillus sp.]